MPQPRRPPAAAPGAAETYDAFESPRAVRGLLPLLDVPEALRYLAEVRMETAAVLADVGPDATLVALVLGHELQHTETMLQTMAIAGRLPVAPAPRALAGQERWVAVAAGLHALGASDDVAFAYDNQPQHVVDLSAFRIAARPVSDASWLRFADGGGYTRREWWTREGWAWKGQSDIVGHNGASSADPAAAVWGISFFEAEAFARSVDARLPTEAEWEKAVASGALQQVGSVWEWTSSFFMGYPGFVAHPPRVLRGVLRERPSRPARGILGDGPSRGHANVRQLGPAAATPALRRRPAGADRRRQRRSSRQRRNDRHSPERTLGVSGGGAEEKLA